ncbi:hypothetical protein J2X85_001428 [Microbacterium trichothecenolyticum]|uniref:hypothetical protein n=1 Tax=Microbacterium trichothecenolyticum TaxID=69370 RepID=UPI002856DAE6|nr:hypothetical protein [Microbacterium trichothecenolyticum]MDR7184405.1 hypothetical protein [Microbacterium trichothecenolyticum]
MARWIEGSAAVVEGVDPYGVATPVLQGWIGYSGDPRTKQPMVGQVFTAHVVLVVGFSRLGYSVLEIGVELPGRTTITGAIRCARRDAAGNVDRNAAADPAVNCPQPPLTMRSDGYLDFLSRQVPQGTTLELLFDLVTSTELDGELMNLHVETEWGGADSAVQVSVYPEGPTPTPSGRVFVEVEPAALVYERPVTFTVHTVDSGNGDPMAGFVEIRNFLTRGGASVQTQHATNQPITMTLYKGPALPPPDNLRQALPIGRAWAAAAPGDPVDVYFPPTGFPWGALIFT